MRTIRNCFHLNTLTFFHSTTNIAPITINRRAFKGPYVISGCISEYKDDNVIALTQPQRERKNVTYFLMKSKESYPQLNCDSQRKENFSHRILVLITPKNTFVLVIKRTINACNINTTPTHDDDKTTLLQEKQLIHSLPTYGRE